MLQERGGIDQPRGLALRAAQLVGACVVRRSGAQADLAALVVVEEDGRPATSVADLS